MAEIRGGYYIKARKIEQSDIAHAPPHVRETWDWLIRNANHKDRRCGDTVIRRGQCLTSYGEIREGLHWKVGWRKMKYSKSQIETAMKWLKKRRMITTQKATRGLFVTIANYDFYQNPKNYENHSHSHTETHNENHRDNRTTNKNEKNEKNKENNNLDHNIQKELTFDKQRFIEGVNRHLRPRNKAQKTTFERIATHLEKLAPERPGLFKDAINWIMEARTKNNPQAYFVQIVKRETGWVPQGDSRKLGNIATTVISAIGETVEPQLVAKAG